MSKNDIPDWASKYIEKGKIIKKRKDKYYLYEHKCIYDKSKKHKNYVKDIYIGRITEDNGLIPTSHFNKSKPENFFCKDYGAYALFMKLGSSILDRLINEFGELYGILIFNIACLRIQETTQYCELEDAFNSSYFSVKYKTLSMSKTYLSDFLDDLAKYKNNMNKFMRSDIESDDILIFDGTNLLCGSNNISYMGYGYKHGHSYKSQINQLYAYSAKNNKPVFYKLLEGSVSDKATLDDVLKESGIKKSIALIDNGFEGDSNITSLLSNKNKYIMALKRSSKLVPEEILNDYGRVKSKEFFINNHETIYAYEIKDNENNRICIFFNKTIESIESSEYIDKMNNGVDGYTEENRLIAQQRFGIYVMKTNIIDLSLSTIYEYYKSRFEIEYMFDTIKNTLKFDKSFMHKDSSLESWAFINHISIILTQKVYDYIKEKKLNISLHQLFKKLRQIKMITSNLDKDENYKLQGIPKKIRELFDILEIN